MADLAVGTDWDIINQALTSSFVEVSYTRPIRGFRVKARGEGNILHKKTSGASAYSTIKGGTAEPHNVIIIKDTPSLGFFATEGGEDTLEVYVYW